MIKSEKTETKSNLSQDNDKEKKIPNQEREESVEEKLKNTQEKL